MSTLTGKTRYRQNWLGQLIVQVGYWATSFAARSPVMVEQWRDATALDMLAIEKGDIRAEAPNAYSFTPRRVTDLAHEQHIPGRTPPPNHARPPPPPPPPPPREIKWL